MFAHFTETVAGLETLRAFRLQDSFIVRDQAMLEQSNRAFWPIQCVNRCVAMGQPWRSQQTELGHT